MPPSRRTVAALVGCALTLVGCADPAPENVRTPTTRVPDVSEVPQLVTTSTAPVGRTAEELRSLGVTADQAACLARSALDRPYDVELPGPPGGEVRLMDGSDVVAVVPAGVRRSAEVWAAVLGIVAPCLDPGVIGDVARRLGDDDDRRAVADDLPGMLEARRSVGFSGEELACVDAALRAAPARISSLAADPRVADQACVEAGRLRYLRLVSTRNRLLVAGATEAEAACLVGDPAEVSTLDQAAGLVAAGAGDGLAELTSVCLDDERLRSLAVTLAAADIQLIDDFG